MLRYLVDPDFASEPTGSLVLDDANILTLFYLANPESDS
jgi:hypothetical protein